jgi:hypothetical protein
MTDERLARRRTQRHERQAAQAVHRLTQPITKSPGPRPRVSRRTAEPRMARSISSRSIPLTTTTLCAGSKSRSARPSASCEADTLMIDAVIRESHRSSARYTRWPTRE